MESQRAYLHRRAVEEDEAADRASNDKARTLHLELATRYRDAADVEPERSDAETVGSTRPREFRILE